MSDNMHLALFIAALLACLLATGPVADCAGGPMTLQEEYGR